MAVPETFHYINIDSADRDFSKYPNAGSFRFHLPFALKFVNTCEVLGLSIPFWSGMDQTISQYGYLIIDIPEINGCLAGVPPKNATAVLTMQPPLTNDRIILCKKIAERSVLTFNPPKTRLDHLTIQIRKPDGTLCDLGGSTDITRQVNLTLKFSVDSLER